MFFSRSAGSPVPEPSPTPCMTWAAGQGWGSLASWGAPSRQRFPKHRCWRFGDERMSLLRSDSFLPPFLSSIFKLICLVFCSLRDNNISDRGMCTLAEHALRCEELQKLA